MKHNHSWTIALAATAVLSACGGGSGTPADMPAPAATDAVPSSASASAQGLKNYLVDLSAMPVNTKEPVDLGSFAPKTTENTEPEPVS